MKSASLEVNNLTAYLHVDEPELHVPLAVQVDYAGVALGLFYLVLWSCVLVHPLCVFGCVFVCGLQGSV
jgi:hypothetical protein